MKTTGQGCGVCASFEREWVDFVIDDALSASRNVRLRSAKIRRAQRALRGLVDDRAWKAYLNLEQYANARAEKELRVLFKRMFAVYTYSRSV